jgi:hypothetical protein
MKWKGRPAQEEFGMEAQLLLTTLLSGKQVHADRIG